MCSDSRWIGLGCCPSMTERGWRSESVVLVIAASDDDNHNHNHNHRAGQDRTGQDSDIADT